MIFGISKKKWNTARLESLTAKYDELYMAMEKVASILQRHDDYLHNLEKRIAELETYLKKAWEANREFAENEKKLIEMAKGIENPEGKPTLH